MYKFPALLLMVVLNFSVAHSQNIGVGTMLPKGKLHIVGNADTTQLLITANSIQSNSRPLILLQNADGSELFRIHSDFQNNTFIGWRAGANNLTPGGPTGNYITFLGGGSGQSNTSGSGNTAIGNVALYNNTIGGFNTAAGVNSLFSNSTGNSNTAYGSQSMGSNTIGNNNTVVGAQALYFNTTGNENTAHGQQALFSNTVGSQNTAIGRLANRNNINGDSNTAVGYRALLENQSGTSNTSIGTYSLNFNVSGSRNTAVGNKALGNNISGLNNTAIGYAADVSSGNLEYATAIGAGARVNCSNCLVLGSPKVGIDIAAPGFPLNFATSMGDKISLFGTSGAHYGFGIAGGLLQIHSDLSASDVAVGYGSNAVFTENFRVKGNGNVLLGISNANATLIFGQSLAKKIVFYQGASGQVGMGVFPGELRLYGDIPGASVTFGNDNAISGFTENMRIDGNGDLFVRNRVFANGLQLTSDARFKKDISIIEHGLEKIMQLNGYNYVWKDDAQDPSLQSGVIAQEVQAILPELVQADNKGYLSVNYAGLVPYLIASIKEQQQQIKKLADEMEELKKLVKELIK